MTIIAVHSETDQSTIAAQLGMSEYSYYFVLQKFRPLLERFGPVVRVADPAREVDALARSAAVFGQNVVFFSFAPPHRTFLGIKTATLPVLAWEFETIPDEVWLDEPRQDWRMVFAEYGRVIVHSEFIARMVRQVMGERYPVVSIPAPVWDEWGRLHDHARPAPVRTTIPIQATVLDTATLPDLSIFANADAGSEPGLAAALAAVTEAQDRPVRLALDGIVYTSVLNPQDGRKNWFDILCAFCFALREREDATLVLKLTHCEPLDALPAMLGALNKVGPFRCRVVMVQGLLEGLTYRELLLASSYTVNASTGEGQCLPLMEQMATGRPAIAPRHTAMLDYVDETNSFLLRHGMEPTQWPHDERRAYRTLRGVLDFESLVEAYDESYWVAKRDPSRYSAMSRAATAAQEQHNSTRVLLPRLTALVPELDVARAA